MLVGILKVLFIGEGGVGKTSLLKRYTWNTFDESMKLTVGVDFAAKNVQKDDWAATLQIWDLGGQIRFRDLAVSYFKGARLAIAVFDISSRYTMDRLHEWIINLYETEPDCPIVIVGNKADLRKTFGETRPLVSLKEAIEYAAQYNAPFLEASAKDGQGVQEIFDVVTQILAERYPTREAAGMAF
ncbi:MAG: Rab family GTPase [Candidatus Thorarchaeota archaeon]